MKEVQSWILDTNVFVSGLLNPAGYPGRLLDAVLAGALRLTYADRIAHEYREVLACPKFGLPPELLETVLHELRNQDAVAALPQAAELPDPDDLPFLEVAA
ncbi:MAG: PIN domain-containing protein [Chthoniobacterales bacterium]|nr:PIN domain-containing protein [Chthoniobacterales bacterium]